MKGRHCVHTDTQSPFLNSTPCCSTHSYSEWLGDSLTAQTRVGRTYICVYVSLPPQSESQCLMFS